jgi:hypothetical protein
MHLSLALACVSGERMRSVKGESPKNSTDARADNKKNVVICGVTSRSNDYVDLIGDFPKLAKHILFRSVSHEGNLDMKKVYPPPYKRRRTDTCKVDRFLRKFTVEKELLVFSA